MQESEKISKQISDISNKTDHPPQGFDPWLRTSDLLCINTFFSIQGPTNGLTTLGGAVPFNLAVSAAYKAVAIANPSPTPIVPKVPASSLNKEGYKWINRDETLEKISYATV